MNSPSQVLIGRMSRSIALLVVLFIKLAITGQFVAAEVNDQAEHSQPSLATFRSGNRPLSSRPTSELRGTSLVERDEDHANVDLDKINESRRYRLTGADSSGRPRLDSNGIDRPLGKMLIREASRLVSNEPRHDYHGLDLLKEDKDDSSIGDSTNNNVFDQQRIANLISSVLRDMKLTEIERLYR